MENLDYQVKQFKALADDTRIKILHLLINQELCGCDLLEAFDITQPTMSYHMKILMDAELVTGRKDGSWMRYTLNENNLCQLIQFLEKVSGFNKSEEIK